MNIQIKIIIVYTVYVWTHIIIVLVHSLISVFHTQVRARVM